MTTEKTAEGETHYTYGTNLLLCVTEKSGITSYVYDSFERLITKTDVNGNEIEYTYDSEGRIASMTVLGEQYTYDYAGNRITRNVNGEEIVYITDESCGLSYIAAKICKETATVYTINGGERISAFVYADIENKAEETQTAYHSFFADSHGNIRGITDVNGSITDSYCFDAYGNICL